MIGVTQLSMMSEQIVCDSNNFVYTMFEIGIPIFNDNDALSFYS